MKYKVFKREEFRVGQRIPAQAELDLAVIEKPLWSFLLRPQFHAKIMNISVRGMQLALPQPLPVGAHLKIWVAVNYRGDTHPLKLQAQVMWCQPAPEPGAFRAGIQLEKLHSRDAQIWADSTLQEIRDFHT